MLCSVQEKALVLIHLQ